MARQRYKARIVAVACIAIGVLCGSAAAAVRLELKLDKGKTYYERSLIEQQITQNVMGQEQIISYTIGVGRKFEVLDVDAQGNMLLRYTYTSSRLKQPGPLGTTEYDSSQSKSVPAGAELFAALIGEGYTLKASPKGKVLDVNGVEEMAQAIAKKAPGVNTSTTQNPGAFLITEEGIREGMEGILAVYPEGPVDVGSSWDQKRITSVGLMMIVESRMTLQKQEAGVATIGSTSTLKSDPKAPPIDNQGTKIKIDIAGTQEGTTQVDEATGLIRMDSSHSLLKGQIGIGTSAEGPFDMMTIPVTFDTKVTVEMSNRPWEDKTM